MPLERVAKCSAKLESHLRAHADYLHIDLDSMVCEFPNQYGDFGGFSFKLKDVGIPSGIKINHSGGDRFSVYLYFFKWKYGNNEDFVMCAHTFVFRGLIKGVRGFVETAKESSPRTL